MLKVKVHPKFYGHFLVGYVEITVKTEFLPLRIEKGSPFVTLSVSYSALFSSLQKNNFILKGKVSILL